MADNTQTQPTDEVNEVDFTATLKMTIKTELVAVLTQMTNEFDLVFEYIPKDNISKLRSLISELESYTPTATPTQTPTQTPNIEVVLQECHKTLLPWEEKIFKVVNSERKIKTEDFLFLNEIKLFDGALDFGLFKDESKNTKRSVVKYLNSIYMSSCFFNIDLGQGNLSDTLSAFADNLQQKMKASADASTNANASTSVGSRRVNRIPRPTRGQQDPTAVFNGLFNSILDNPDIMNMATDLSKDLQRENVDPMSLISGLMSGRPNAQLNRLVGNITSKIEQKISNGEISKDALEAQAQSIMNAVNESELAEQLPMFKEFANAKQFRK
ncbi:MAG: hypothetical protein EBU90_04780 [Proteobacteria bacterium]|nr:hypothetical protein [Pseudomonadota bacterium]NBP13767.1 hypothetical protein [bacterium]